MALNVILARVTLYREVTYSVKEMREKAMGWGLVGTGEGWSKN